MTGLTTSAAKKAMQQAREDDARKQHKKKPEPTSVKKTKTIKICPMCGSTKITPYTKTGGFWGEHLSDFCADCNYGYPNGAGFIPEIPSSEVKDFRDNLKKNNPSAKKK